mgnify:CR=1 FL=1
MASVTTKEGQAMNEQEKDCIYNMIDLADNAILQGDKDHALTSLYFIKKGLQALLMGMEA